MPCRTSSAQVAVLTGIPAVQYGHIHYQVGGILVLSGADHRGVFDVERQTYVPANF